MQVNDLVAGGLFSSILFVASCSEGTTPTGSESPATESTSQRPAVTAEAEGHAKMVEWLDRIRAGTATENLYQGEEEMRKAREALEAHTADSGEAVRIQLVVELARCELNFGHDQLAIELLEELHAELPAALAAGVEPLLAHKATFSLGVAYLRLGENENCCAINAPGSCILPIEGAAVHTRPEGSTKAIGCFMEVLEAVAPELVLHMEARWLLNVAYMTLGRFPDGVPSEYLIPEEAFAKIDGFPHFENISTKMGLDNFSLSGSVIADDFDGDDLIDLLVSTWETDGQLRYHHNDGDGKFSDRTDAAGLKGLFGGLNMIQADYDNDGDVDVLVLRGAWLFEDGQHPNSLLRNDGGKFTDVTFAAGMGGSHQFPTQTASWADYDLDGDLDLFIGNESTPNLEAPCQLWNNQGDGTFVDVAEAAGVTNMGFSKSVNWGDYDNDRYPDLYVSNNGGANRLYHNEGDGTFVDKAIALGVDKPIYSFPAWFWDVNNDGLLDLFVSAYSGGIGHLAASYLGRPSKESSVARLYLGTPKGGFESVGARYGLVRPALPMGSNFGDLDGDGWLDFYLGTGNPDFKNLLPNAMFMNRRGRFFMDVSTTGGFAHLQKGHGIVFADLDNDGDMDVFEQMGGAYRSDAFRDALYENPGFGTDWLKVQLVGTRSNRFGVGARLRVIMRKGDQGRSIYKHVNSGATFGGNPMRQTIGLSRGAQLDHLEVFWPVTGETQTIRGLSPNTAVRITEGKPGFETIDLPSFTLGG